MAAFLVLLFSFTAGGLIWLTRDVNERVALRSTAQSIAFQSARAGAQQVSVSSLRSSGAEEVSLDVELVMSAAASTAQRLIAAYEVRGSAAPATIDRSTVTVTVTLVGPDGTAVTGLGSARPSVRS